MSSRTYQNAVNDLNSLQSNATVLDTLRATGNQFAIPEMLEYLGRIGYTVRLPCGRHMLCLRIIEIAE